MCVFGIKTVVIMTKHAELQCVNSAYLFASKEQIHRVNLSSKGFTQCARTIHTYVSEALTASGGTVTSVLISVLLCYHT